MNLRHERNKIFYVTRLYENAVLCSNSMKRAKVLFESHERTAPDGRFTQIIIFRVTAVPPNGPTAVCGLETIITAAAKMIIMKNSRLLFTLKWTTSLWRLCRHIVPISIT